MKEVQSYAKELLKANNCDHTGHNTDCNNSTFELYPVLSTLPILNVFVNKQRKIAFKNGREIALSKFFLYIFMRVILKKH
jgi:hypothetical protein